MIRYKVFPEKKLISVRLEGQINFDDLHQWHRMLGENKEYRADFDAIVDHRRAKLKLNPQDMKRLVAVNHEMGLIKGRWVHLTDTPVETALAKTYQTSAKDLHEVEVYCTVSSVSDYLGLDVRPFLLTP